MRHFKQFCVAAVFTAGLVACGPKQSHTEAGAAAPTADAEQHEKAMCPMKVSGARVMAEDTADGVAMVFTTDQANDVVELQRRVQHMADMHNQHHAPGAMTGHQMGEHHDHHGKMMIPSMARAEQMQNGARLVITPQDATQLSDLRMHVRQHADAMAGGHCPMADKADQAG